MLSLNSDRTLLGGYLEKDYIWRNQCKLCESPIKPQRTFEEQVSRDASALWLLSEVHYLLRHAE